MRNRSELLWGAVIIGGVILLAKNSTAQTGPLATVRRMLPGGTTTLPAQAGNYPFTSFTNNGGAIQPANYTGAQSPASLSPALFTSGNNSPASALLQNANFSSPFGSAMSGGGSTLTA